MEISSAFLDGVDAGQASGLPPIAESGATASPSELAEPPRERLVSLDAFRGLTVAAMLVVNNTVAEAAPPTLAHAAWGRGIHFADLIFPWFLFIVGAALPFSLAAQRRKGSSRLRIQLRVLGRTVALVLLGCLVDSSQARTPVLGLGVLQLIGLAYGTASVLYALLPSGRVVVPLLLLVGHWALIRFLPVPGAGAGVWTETQNAIVYLNQVYLEPFRLKGLVSVIPTAAMVLLGATAGEWLQATRRAVIPGVLRLVVAGIALVSVGSVWSLDLQYSKPFWTAPYILACAGWGMVTLGLIYGIVDGCRKRWLAFPLVVFGSNAIVAYVAPILFKIHVLREWTWTMADGSHYPLAVAIQSAAYTHLGRVWGAWAYTVGFIVLCWLGLFWLYRRRIFLRV